MRKNDLPQKNTLQSIEKLVEEGKINKALRKIQFSVLKVTTDEHYTAVRFDSPELDRLCQNIGDRVSRKIREDFSYSNTCKHANVIVCSRLQSSGGHTRVIEDFIRHLPDNDVLVLVTEVPGKSDRKHVGQRLASLGATVVWLGSGNLEQRLYYLGRRLLETQPTDIFLFNHHEDSVAVSAVQVVKDSRVHFYHHGDHHLTLGIHIEGVDHIDIHAFGYNNCRKNLGVKRNTYLPLAIEDKGGNSSLHSFMRDGFLTTCTAAGKNKVEVKHSEVSYIDFIPKLLSSSKRRHIHIGKLSWSARQRIRRSLIKMGVDKNMFVYIPWVQSVWEVLHKHKVDLYLSSFPITGGRTLIESMGAGVPLVLYNNTSSRLLSGIDLVYEDAFIWSTEKKLLEYLEGLTPERLTLESKQARHHYKKYYRDDLMRSILNQRINVQPPPLNPFDEQRQFIKGDAYRTAADIEPSLRSKVYLRLKYLRSILSNLV